MKFIKKSVLMLLTILLVLTNISTIIAEDGNNQSNTNSSASYSAFYDFVLDTEGDLPDEVMKLLPDTITDLKEGDIITNSPIDDVETDDVIYRFLHWSTDEFKVSDSDVHFTGTWTKVTKQTNSNPDPSPSTPAPNPNTSSDTYTVYFEFVEFSVLKDSKLPDEVMKLKPETQYVKKGEKADMPNLEGTQIGSYVFDHWESGIQFFTGEIVFFGVWKKMSMVKSIPHPGTDPDAYTGASSAISIGGAGNSRHQYLGGSDAYCIEVYVTGYANAGHPYWITGNINARIAEIIWLGQKNGRSYGAIQAAIWNYLSGTLNYTYGSENVDPNSSDYNGKGAYTCWGTKYETYDPGTGAIQNLTPSSSVGCRINNGYAKVKKVSSDSNYDYGSYTNNYSLAGAVYGLYTDMECTNQIGTFTTNANGDSNSIEFNSSQVGTYYVKEITPSKGFKIDTTVYTARISLGNTTVITSYEDPYNDPVPIELYKQNAKEKTHVKYLDEAEFTVSYYDALDEDITGLTPKKQWVFKPIFDEYGIARIIMDSEHYVRGDTLPLDSTGTFYLPLGTFTVQETKAPQTYQIDPTVYIGRVYRENDETKVYINGGQWLEVENLSLTQSEREVILSTTAIFEENGEHRYVADGVAHIVDEVEYDWLIPESYYKVVGKLMKVELTETKYTQEEFDQYVLDNGVEPDWAVGDVKDRTKTEIEEVMTAETVFKPEAETGTVSVRFDGIDFDLLENTSYVVYEYLYLLDTEDPVIDPLDPNYDPDAPVVPIIKGEELITYHEDLYDEGQSVYVDPLYRAAFVLYKISNNNKNIKLSGAYFKITTERTKRDGRVVEKDLGIYVTGGIFLMGDDATTEFSVDLYQEPQATEDPETGQLIPPASTDPVFIKTYTSSITKNFDDVQTISILGLEDGIYYTKQGSITKKWNVAKGMIFLPEQEEDTLITFTELYAPSGYVLDKRPFTMTVGHNYSVERVENFRSNNTPYNIPKTGD